MNLVKRIVDHKIEVTKEAVSNVAKRTTANIKYRNKAIASYRVKQQGSSTSYQFEFLNKSGERAFWIRHGLGHRFSCTLWARDALPIGRIVQHRILSSDLDVEIGDEIIGNISWRRGNMVIQIPRWSIEHTLGSYILMYDSVPMCYFYYPGISSGRIDLLAAGHTHMSLLICSAIITNTVAEWASEKAALGGG